MILSSIGTIIVALSLMTTDAWTAALYYLVHSTIIAAAFYLLSGWITSQRGQFKDHFKNAPVMKQNTLVSICFFIIALMMAGLPPFSGFFGKVFVLQASQASPYQLTIIITVLIVSLLSIIAFTRVGFVLFWRSTAPEMDVKEKAFEEYANLPSRPPARNDKTIYLMLSGLVLYVVFAHPIMQYLEKTSAQLQNAQLYYDAVLKVDSDNKIISVQPFDPNYLPETKYDGESADPNARFIPYIISEKTLDGEHISEYKQRQIQQQEQDLKQEQDLSKLKPMEQ